MINRFYLVTTKLKNNRDSTALLLIVLQKKISFDVAYLIAKMYSFLYVLYTVINKLKIICAENLPTYFVVKKSSFKKKSYTKHRNSYFS